MLRLYLLFPVDICKKTSLPIYTIEITFVGYETSTICNNKSIPNIYVYRILYALYFYENYTSFRIVYDFDLECLQYARNQAKWIPPNLAYENHGDHIENMMHVPNHFLRSQFRLFCRRYKIAKVKMNITYPRYWFEGFFETSMKIPALVIAIHYP